MLIKSIDLQSSMAHVLLVRRIRPESNSKRKRMAMFAPDGQLIELEFALADISDSYVNPTRAEHQMFKQSCDEFVNKALDAEVVSWNIYDRVHVGEGSFVGIDGHITEIHDDKTITVSNHLTHSIPLSDFPPRSSPRTSNWAISCRSTMGGMLVKKASSPKSTMASSSSIYRKAIKRSAVYHQNAVTNSLQCEASLSDIDWSPTNEKIRKTISHVEPTLSIRKDMYTSEEYKDMEVKITAGPLKGRTAWSRQAGN
jgi:hypothetical protein